MASRGPFHLELFYDPMRSLVSCCCWFVKIAQIFLDKGRI